jgi:oligoribonuclease (3'-5' exoribonuclease)
VQLIDHLHYRIVDVSCAARLATCLCLTLQQVSTIKELVTRWYPAPAKRWQGGKGAHRALEDIRGSIEGVSSSSPALTSALTPCAELRHYREHAFVKP